MYMNDSLRSEIDSLMYEYYEQYYCKSLGLPDCKGRIKNRLDEDNHYSTVVDRFRQLIPFFYINTDEQKVLVDGAGTGADFIAFSKLGYNTFAIEPNEKACEILRLKCRYYGFPEQNIYQGIAEQLPYEDNSFGLVWSWTVLEHVNDVKKAIEEIHRVLEPGGWAFLALPDYRQFYEGHYKMYVPMFLPKFILKIIFRMKGRPTSFLDWGINYTNARKIRNILQHMSFDILRIIPAWKEIWKSNRNLSMNCIYWTARITGIQRSQCWIVRKK